jgi:hypothetical protein
MNKYQLGVQVLQRKIKGNRNCQVGVEAALFNRMVKKRLFFSKNLKKGCTCDFYLVFILYLLVISALISMLSCHGFSPMAL